MMENLQKIIDAIGQFIAKEFLWSLVTLLLAFLMALITRWAINNVDPQFEQEVMDLGITEVEYFLILYAFYVVFIYLVRMVFNAIKTLKKEE